MPVTPVLLITYDISDNTNRSLVVKEIGKFPNVMLSESSYAIRTNKTPTAIFSKFKNLICKKDHFYVINLRKPFDGQGYEYVNDWLDEHLPL